MGWTTKSGVQVTSGMRRYMNRLAREVPFSITLTSGVRDARSQAAAMIHKLEERGPSELRSLYQDRVLVEKLLATSPTVSAWARVISREGEGISRHLVGGAIDLRTRDLTGAQVSELVAAVRATGGRPLVEYDHIHVDLPLRYVSAMRKGLPVLVTLWALGGIGLGVVIYLDQKKRKAAGRRGGGGARKASRPGRGVRAPGAVAVSSIPLTLGAKARPRPRPRANPRRRRRRRRRR